MGCRNQAADLRLVQHDDAAGQPVQFAAARGVLAAKMTEEPHIGGDDEGASQFSQARREAVLSLPGASAWL